MESLMSSNFSTGDITNLALMLLAVDYNIKDTPFYAFKMGQLSGRITSILARGDAPPIEGFLLEELRTEFARLKNRPVLHA